MPSRTASQICGIRHSSVNARREAPNRLIGGNAAGCLIGGNAADIRALRFSSREAGYAVRPLADEGAGGGEAGGRHMCIPTECDGGAPLLRLSQPGIQAAKIISRCNTSQTVFGGAGMDIGICHGTS